MADKQKTKPFHKSTVPVDWDIERLDAIASVIRGSSPRPAGDPRYFNGSFAPWLTVASLTNIPDEQVTVTNTEGFLTLEGSKLSRNLKKGTLILSNSGATLGIAKILGVDCCANDGIAAFVNWEDNKVDKLFALYFLNSRTRYFRDVVAPGNGQPNLNTDLIGIEHITIPPLAEQKAIAHVLGLVDKAIELNNKIIAQKELRKKWLMQNLLTGKKRLKGFTAEWKEASLSQIGKFSKGAGISKDEVTESGLPCVRYGEIYTRHNVIIQDFASFVSEVVAKGSKEIKKGDILFAGSGETLEEIGKSVAYVGEEVAYAGGDIIVLSTSKAVSVEYIAYFLESDFFQRQKRRYGQGQSVVHIYRSDLAKLVVLLPEKEEQIAIAKVFLVADEEIRSMKKRSNILRLLKKGMMQQLLTGKRRLKV